MNNDKGETNVFGEFYSMLYAIVLRVLVPQVSGEIAEVVQFSDILGGSCAFRSTGAHSRSNHRADLQEVD